MTRTGWAGVVLAVSIRAACGAEESTVASAAWLDRAQAHIALQEYAITEQTRSVIPDHAGGLHAANREQNLRAYFTPEGVDIVLRTVVTPHWVLRLVPEAVLPDGGTVPLFSGPPAVEGSAVLYAAPDAALRVENAPEGMRWRISAAGAVRLRLDGNVTAVGGDDGRRVSFYAEGVPVAHLDLLSASIDSGEPWAARLSVESGSVNLDGSGTDEAATFDLLLTGPGGAALGGPSTTPNASVEGNQAGANLGWSSATGGDIDGDGYSDVIVGVPYFDNGQTDEGAVFIYRGSSSGLLTSPAWRLEINAPSASLGWSVATAGDVNADGFADIIAGAPFRTLSQTAQGEVVVYLGSASGPVTPPHRQFFGTLFQENFGYSVSPAGDPDGNGYSDVIVGAPGYSNGEAGEGRASVYFGYQSTGGLNTAAGWGVESGVVGAHFGWSVAWAGDVNGDPYSDVIIGAPDWSNDQALEGAAFIYDGMAAAPHLPWAPSVTLEGNSVQSDFGMSVSTAGDMNGDGYSDVLVGAQYMETVNLNEGRASLYLGSIGGISPAAVWYVESRQDDGRLGYSVASAGDVNGDGYGDILVGAPFLDVSSGADGGRVYLYYGSGSALPTGPSWFFSGPQAGEQLGTSVATAGDINNDGFSDVVLGATHYTNGQNVEGRALVFHGAADAPLTTPVATVFGDAADQWGFSVASAGDVNGDHYDDVIVGAPFWDYFQLIPLPGISAPDAGEAAVYHGSAAGLEVQAAWSEAPSVASARTGWSVSPAGDVNGDGFGDVAVGYPGYSSNRGRVGIFHGSSAGLASTVSRIFIGGLGDQLGQVMAAAGDVNGDGYGDLIVGEPHSSTIGLARVFHGSATGLAQNAARTLTGVSTGEDMGFSVASAGDVNGDGYSDVIVGSPGTDRARIYHGSPEGISPVPAVTLTAPGANGFGQSVAGAGDINGDGYSDVIIGAPLADNGQIDEGQIRVYMGSPNGVSTSPSRIWEPNLANSRYGYAVTSAGDVNGDGLADVLVGAPGGAATIGSVYLYAGSPAGLNGSPLWYGSGVAGRLFGHSVASAGDINGDGFADIAIGSPGAGKAELFLGTRGGRLRRPVQRQLNGAAVVGPLGRSDATSGFDLEYAGGAALGRGLARPQAEVRPLGTVFSNQPTHTGPLWGAASSGQTIAINGLAAGVPYSWRVRAQYHSATTPLLPHGRWITKPWNGAAEKKLRTAGCRDLDSDGFTAPADPLCAAAVDCDDGRASVKPGGAQICGDGLNNDCDQASWPSTAGTNDGDDDQDGYSECAGDCNDAQVYIRPGGVQLCNDGLNNDCLHPSYPSLVGTNEWDDDMDGFTDCQRDCLDNDTGVWQPASAASNLSFVSAQNMIWDAPSLPGGVVPLVYDVLRLPGISFPYFDTSACVETDDADRTAMDATVPSLVVDGGIFYYLVRGESPCGGSVGTDSAGFARYSRTCP